MYTALIIAVVVVIGLAILFIRAKRERDKQQKIAEGFVATIFASQEYRPEAIAGVTYGIPSFTLKFKTDQEKEHAITNGLTEQFIRNIQGLCGHLRPRDEPYDAARAVAIYSTEDEKRWAEQATAYRNEEA